MLTNWNRFVILLWKNFRIHRSRPLIFCALILLPILACWFLLSLHQQKKLEIYTEPMSWMPENIDLCLKHSGHDTKYCNIDHRHVFYTPDYSMSRRIISIVNDSKTSKFNYKTFSLFCLSILLFLSIFLYDLSFPSFPMPCAVI